MSAEIRSEYYPEDTLGINVDGEGDPGVVIHNNLATNSIRIPRADFLDAIRTELNVIVIDRAELPEVTVDSGGHVAVDGEHFNPGGTAGSAYRFALRDLALAEHYATNPPADPEKVKILADTLYEAQARGDFERFAEQLISSGRIDIKDPS